MEQPPSNNREKVRLSVPSLFAEKGHTEDEKKEATRLS
jgi:hypothetical protein